MHVAQVHLALLLTTHLLLEFFKFKRDFGHTLQRISEAGPFCFLHSYFSHTVGLATIQHAL